MGAACSNKAKKKLKTVERNLKEARFLLDKLASEKRNLEDQLRDIEMERDQDELDGQEVLNQLKKKNKEIKILENLDMEQQKKNQVLKEELKDLKWNIVQMEKDNKRLEREKRQMMKDLTQFRKKIAARGKDKEAQRKLKEKCAEVKALKEELQAELQKEAEQHSRLKSLAAMYEEVTEKLEVLKLEKEELLVKLETEKVKLNQSNVRIVDLESLFKNEQKSLKKVHKRLDATTTELNSLRMQLDEEQKHENALLDSLQKFGFNIQNEQRGYDDSRKQKLKSQKREIDQIVKMVNYNKGKDINNHRSRSNGFPLRLP